MKRKEVLAAGGLAAVLGFGWYQFVWQSQGAAATKAAEQREAAEQTATKLKTQVATLQRTQSELEQQKASVALINQAIPDAPDQSSLLKLLQARASELKVTIGTISNGQVAAATVGVAAGQTAPAKANEMSLTLSVHGAYADVVAYVHALAQLPRLVVVDSVSMQTLQSQSKPGEVARTDQISANVSARVFTTAEPPTPAGVPVTTTAPANGTPATTAAAKSGTNAQP